MARASRIDRGLSACWLPVAWLPSCCCCSLGIRLLLR